MIYKSKTRAEDLDFFLGVTRSAAYFSYIQACLHNYSYESCIVILRNVVSVIASDSKLLIANVRIDLAVRKNRIVFFLTVVGYSVLSTAQVVYFISTM